MELAEAGYDIAVVSADTQKSMYVDLLKKDYPGRCFEVGIAEQNMILVAAGLAASGKIAFSTSYSVFTSMRVLEQLRTFVAYPCLNVKIAAGLGGFSAGIEGVTHIAMEDLGIVRCIPNIMVVNPADAIAAKKAVKAAADHIGPVYLRLGRDDSPVIFGDDYVFELGKANVLDCLGNDAAIIATGCMVRQAVDAARLLKKEGIGVKLVEVHTLKPIDEDEIARAARETGALVTVEEHNCIGGLRSAVSEIVAKCNPVPIEAVAVWDVFTQSGRPDELRDYYGLTREKIIEMTRKVIKRKRD